MFSQKKQKAYRNHISLSMPVEKWRNVWDELKKIEAKAEQIRTEAQSTAKSISDLAKQDGEKLIANSQIYADEKRQQLYHKYS